MSASDATDVSLNQLNYSGITPKTINQAFQKRGGALLHSPDCFGYNGVRTEDANSRPNWYPQRSTHQLFGQTMQSLELHCR